MWRWGPLHGCNVVTPSCGPDVPFIVFTVSDVLIDLQQTSWKSFLCSLAASVASPTLEQASAADRRYCLHC